IQTRNVRQLLRGMDQLLSRKEVNFVCVWIDSPGGSHADSIRLAQRLADLETASVHTVAYIPVEARSDASLAALACDSIVMAPDAVIGGQGAGALSERGRESLTP